MKRALLLLLCTFALPAVAFEGIIETKMTFAGKDAQMSGTGIITIKGLSTRMDTQMTAPKDSPLPTGAMKTIVIHRAEEPNVTYVLHEASKTYSKLDANEAPVRDASKYTVKRLGKETIAGRSTDHVMISQEGGEASEVWVDTKLVSSSDLAKAFAGRGDPGGWWKALEKEGLGGVPLKLVSHDSSGKEKVVWEATKVEAKSVPSSAFEIPAGYTQGGGPGMGGAMNKLTPEQRKQLEEMMKQRQTGK